ncbi:hypothetical protein C8R43DRAFT_1134937 [Mycena crocata]|nr:hypothetical protein C8R43DRAFT_1134937 [Mycena crocata]
MSAQWCLDECFQCGRVLDGPTNFCSPQCEAAARPPSPDTDDTDDDADYASWHRVAQWAHAVHPSPPPSPPVFASPSKRILTPQHPTAALTSNNPVPAKAHASPPRPARTPRTAAESLQASSTASPSPISLGGFVRSWAHHRPQLPRLTTANFAVFAKTHPQAPPPLPSDETTTSDGDVSPVWWLAAEPDSSASSPASRLVVHRRAPAPRGRKAVRA